MAHTKSSDPKPAGVKPLFEKKWWIWVIGALCVLVILIYPSSSSGGKSSETSAVETPPVKPEKKPVVRTITRELYPVRWCEWVKLPGDVDFMIDAPGWWQLQYPDGTCTDRIAEKVRFLGTIHDSTFKILGEKGTAIITYEVPK